MCDHPNREAAMVIVAPGVWCDPCLAPIVRALNTPGTGLPTVTSQRTGTELATLASCCGHGKWPGSIVLADGRYLVLAASQEEVERLAAEPTTIAGVREPGKRGQD